MLNTLIRHRDPTEQELEDFIEQERIIFLDDVLATQETFDKFDSDYEVLQSDKVREALFNCIDSQQALSAESFAESIIEFVNRIFNEYEKPKLNYDQLRRDINDAT